MMEEQQAGESAGSLEAVVAEFFRNVRGPVAQGLSWPAASAYGARRGEAGATAADLVREVFGAVCGAIDRLGEKDRSAALAAHLRGVGAEAVASAVAAWETQRRDRREQWLSYLVHDLKNPLNTVLNAVWLVRGKLGDREDVDKLLGMVERAAHKMEAGLAEVRDLERRHVAAAPRRTHG